MHVCTFIPECPLPLPAFLRFWRPTPSFWPWMPRNIVPITSSSKVFPDWHYCWARDPRAWSTAGPSAKLHAAISNVFLGTYSLLHPWDAPPDFSLCVSSFGRQVSCAAFRAITQCRLSGPTLRLACQIYSHCTHRALYWHIPHITTTRKHILLSEMYMAQSSQALAQPDWSESTPTEADDAIALLLSHYASISLSHCQQWSICPSVSACQSMHSLSLLPKLWPS